MTTIDQFALPCLPCCDGLHDRCVMGACGCIADHENDPTVMRAFKRIKRKMHPERESWTKGGWPDQSKSCG